MLQLVKKAFKADFLLYLVNYIDFRFIFMGYKANSFSPSQCFTIKRNITFPKLCFDELNNGTGFLKNSSEKHNEKFKLSA